MHKDLPVLALKVHDDVLQLVNARDVLFIVLADLIVLSLEVLDLVALLIKLVLLFVQFVVTVLVGNRFEPGVLDHKLANLFPEIEDCRFFPLQLVVHVENS